MINWWLIIGSNMIAYQLCHDFWSRIFLMVGLIMFAFGIRNEMKQK